MLLCYVNVQIFFINKKAILICEVIRKYLVPFNLGATVLCVFSIANNLNLVYQHAYKWFMQVLFK